MFTRRAVRPKLAAVAAMAATSRTMSQVRREVAGAAGG